MRDWGTEKATERDDTLKQTYEKHDSKWGDRYRPCFARVRRIWDRIMNWLKLNSPDILDTINEGATEEEINEIEEALGFEMPLEMRLSYRLHDGQSPHTGPRHGLFGGYKCYDLKVNLRMCPLEHMKQMRYALRSDFPAWLKKVVPIARTGGSAKHFFLVTDSVGSKLTAGRIVEPSGCFEGAFHVANSFIELLEDHVTKLETGQFQVSKKPHKEIIRYPCKGGTSTKVTRGVQITACPLFCAERSTVEGPSNFFAYRIQMQMSPQASEELRCKLVSRHWIITHDGKKDEVKGPGVIGKHPEMFPGAYFEYASCSPSASRTGDMCGAFQMRVSATAEIFDAVVPEFHFSMPEQLMSS